MELRFLTTLSWITGNLITDLTFNGNVRRISNLIHCLGWKVGYRRNSGHFVADSLPSWFFLQMSVQLATLHTRDIRKSNKLDETMLATDQWSPTSVSVNLGISKVLKLFKIARIFGKPAQIFKFAKRFSCGNETRVPRAEKGCQTLVYVNRVLVGSGFQLNKNLSMESDWDLVRLITPLIYSSFDNLLEAFSTGKSRLLESWILEGKKKECCVSLTMKWVRRSCEKQLRVDLPIH